MLQQQGLMFQTFYDITNWASKWCHDIQDNDIDDKGFIGDT
jgi:hypothetical protein